MERCSCGTFRFISLVLGGRGAERVREKEGRKEGEKERCPGEDLLSMVIGGAIFNSYVFRGWAEPLE